MYIASTTNNNIMKKGDKILIKGIARITAGELKSAVVTRIGTKYFYADAGGTVDYKFDKESMKEKTLFDQISNYEAHLSMESVESSKAIGETTSIINKLLGKKNIGLHKLDLTKLKAIQTILES